MTAKTKKEISRIGRSIKRAFKPRDIILFGSYANGSQSKDSDIDIMVVMKTKVSPYKKAAEIRMFLNEKAGVKTPVDVIVRTPKMIEARLKVNDMFIKDILSEGSRL